jgi:hypothetical protein
MEPAILRQIIKEAMKEGLQSAESPHRREIEACRREFDKDLKALCEKADLRFANTELRFSTNEKALEKAEQNMERRLTDINAGQLATKTELGVVEKGLRERITSLGTVVTSREGAKRITDWLLMAIIAVIVTAVLRFLGW